jgi:D-beta-D-heptose 7-phosphate kinase/D-beta-D-heptose 1-phosphate adenosyltransferase
MIVGMTSGCFDLIHFGHVVYLEKCKTLCNKLIVGIDNDIMVRAVKGKMRPLIPEQERLAMVNSLDPVDSAFILNEIWDLERMSVQFSVDKVFKHEGFEKTDYIIGVQGTKAELVIVPDVPGLVSTSDIIRRVLNRYEGESITKNNKG